MPGCMEGYYTMACLSKNTSACRSYEHACGRKPFMANRVRPPIYGATTYFHVDPITQERGRLYVGARFPWRGEKEVEVTSFAQDGSYLTACSYKPKEYDERGFQIGPTKIAKRYTITLADLKAARKDEQ